jgi:hypothetical protein
VIDEKSPANWMLPQPLPVAATQPELDATANNGLVNEFPLCTNAALAAVTVNGAENVNFEESVLPPEKPPKPPI